ncbi:MAG: histidine kinase [Tannerella sp.]|jgi:two-component sensor histidine kinase|nr:histidine kinase [Tannerella sp.]
MKRNRIMGSICLLLLCLSVAAQSLVTSEYNYRHYGIADGLPTEIVECIYQDSRGFIWFGTEHGCVCFDGHTFRTYLANKSLPINKIEENGDGNIVIYGYYFIYVLDVKTDELQMTFRDRNLNYDVDKSPGLPRGYGIYTKRDTRKQAVFCLQDDTLAEFFSHPLLEEMDYGQSVYYDVPGRQFYIPSRNNRIHAVDLDGNVKAVFDNIDVCRFVETETELLAVGYDHVWKISEAGVEPKYRFPYNIARPSQNSDRDLAVITDGDGNLIIRDTKGVFRYRDGKFETVIDHINIPRSILFDREGNLWFTSRQGIYNFFKLNFITYKVNPQDADIVYSIVPIRNDEVYLATGNGKLLHFGNDRFEELHYPRHPESTTEFSYRSIRAGETYYFTTYSDILQYRNGRFRWLNIPPEQYHVASCVMNGNELAIGGWGRLFILNGDGRVTREISHVDIRRPTIYTVQADDENRLWIGGHDGICRIGATDSLFFFGEHTMNAETSDKDRSGRIWFGCEGHIYHTDGDTIRLFMEFPNVIIGNLRYTRNDRIVVSDNTGIRIIDAETRRTVSYDYANGYSAGEPSWNTMTEDCEGNIWMGTQGPNVLKFNPAELMHGSHQPRLYITSAQYSENNIDMNDLPEDGASLNHRQRNFRFSFVGLCYSNPQNVRYRYRLTGFQDEWSQPVAEREVTFNNLSPGRYEFQLVACTDDSGVQTAVASRAFTVSPAFRQTWWFYSACMVILVLITGFAAYGYLNWKNRAKIAAIERRRQLNSLQIQSIRLRSIPHFNANVLAGIEYYIANFSKEEANRYLAMYASFTNITLNDVDRPARTLEQEIAYVRLYLDLQKMRFGDSLEFSIEIDEQTDATVMLPNMILHTHCENAIKHGLRPKKGKGRLHLKAASLHGGEELFVSIEDDGIGRIEAERLQTQGTRQGLNILTQQINLYNQTNHKKIIQRIIDLYDPDSRPAGTRIEIIAPRVFIFN